MIWRILSCVLCGATFGYAAPEPWADPKLSVHDGLTLWLDATRAWGDQLAPFDGKLKEWRDASGNKRHLLQPNANAQPTRLPCGKMAIVRFDGNDDVLRAVKQGQEVKTGTIFIMMAPKQNLGLFRGVLSFNARSQRDYESGFNLDFGPAAGTQFNVVNIEGRGFGGAKNLRTKSTPFGRVHVIETILQEKGISLLVDGQAEGQRDRTGDTLSMDEMTLGARYYNNGPGDQTVTGFGKCDIAEVLVYQRVLSEKERDQVRAYLTQKYDKLSEQLPPDAQGVGEPLLSVKDPPHVQVFAPGFSAHEIPVDLTNVNNVKYRPDGTLVALGYDGRIWTLRDTNGDGVEDQATLFWENKSGLRSTIGMDLTPPGYKHGDGVFVVGKTRCVLIVDTNGDGKGDKEIEIAGGWKESFHQVDGLGIAYDPKDGSIYFGRGTYNFADPLLRDKDGKPHYSLKDESAAIIRVSPDFKTREIVATGIRFPVAIRINKQGDLFATDQEGATWVPNGNPLDELLHVQKGRHYGFPPRHPKHLPNVIDEPSTFDYGPQHQSTCGLNFNEPVKEGGPTFGPKHYASDAWVTGYSRGKLYRTSMVKTPAGYVAKTQLFACLNMLTADACFSPDGTMVVACHSGGPDWGSGPTGKGKLFRIRYTDRDHPQPLFAWPATDREVHVEFDRPVNPELLREVLKNTKLTGGMHVRAGDRFESLWPGYAIVQAQKVAPRFDIPVRSAQLTADRRTLVLAVDPLPTAMHYALQLPGMGRPKKPIALELEQHAAIDLDFDLSGVQATWTASDGKTSWQGWLPSLDLAVAKAFTQGSATHAQLWDYLKQEGSLQLRTQLNLTDMLRPAVQPGSTVDEQLPFERVTLQYNATGSVQLVAKETQQMQAQSTGNQTTGSMVFQPQRDVHIPLELTLKGRGLHFTLSYTTNEDRRERPVQVHRQVLPWANTKAVVDKVQPIAVPELAGGSWARGRKEFFGEQAACAKCHTIHGQGGDLGPDLSNLVHRDYASVLRDITKPSFAINPDHLTYTVRMADGRTLTGVVRTMGDKVRVGDLKGNVVEVAKTAIESMKPSALSTMPEDLLKPLGDARTRDLLSFLLIPAPSMPRDYPGPAPKARSRAEVNAVLAGAPSPPAKSKKIRVLLVAGPKDHGPGEHDYPAWQKAWAELLAAADNIEVGTAWEWPAKEEFTKADVMVFYQHGNWDGKRAADIDAYLERGGGLVYIHWAVDGQKGGQAFGKRIGLAGMGAVAFRHGNMELKLQPETKHPVLRNFGKLSLVDETYWKMVGQLPGDRILGTAIEDGKPQPQLWSLERGTGRVFVSIPGHYSWTFDDPLFRVLLLRGIAWSAKEPVDRFNDLVWPGANVAK